MSEMFSFQDTSPHQTVQAIKWSNQVWLAVTVCVQRGHLPLQGRWQYASCHSPAYAPIHWYWLLSSCLKSSHMFNSTGRYCLNMLLHLSAHEEVRQIYIQQPSTRCGWPCISSPPSWLCHIEPLLDIWCINEFVN